MPDTRTEQAIEIMTRYAERTGLTSEQARQRYLWTDAFAVCNFIGLAQTTGKARYRQLALQLIDQVHRTLGRFRHDDSRSGWISGLDEREGAAHPTLGGLRIGKELPERGAAESFDEALEWERDGQYFHYLTQWMHALDQATRATGQPVFNTWGRELAESAYDAFTYVPPGGVRKRMYWKMSIDLSRPLVASMGQHDPLDGYLSAIQLQTTADLLPGPVQGPYVGDLAGQYAAMVAHGSLVTADPLGLGGLLVDAARVEQLMHNGSFPDGELLEALLSAALAGLDQYARQQDLRLPAPYRLPFRELGLAIGLHALAGLRDSLAARPERLPNTARLRARLEALMHYAPLGDEIESFWRDPAQQQVSTWSEHRNINEVMLATRLAPEGFLVLSSPRINETSTVLE
ncbi:MAG: hypothetical protein PVI50_07845 [Gammaproteobacteria bacterium]|jgi:hypothetical protein